MSAPTSPYGELTVRATAALVGTLAPGVYGYTVETKQGTYIPIIGAQDEGSGAVGRYLDGLDRSRTWKFPTVISSRLVGMLQRRGWQPKREYNARDLEWEQVWVLPALPS